MRSREQLAWAAGLFDGEGWATAARYSRAGGGMTSTVTLGVGQAHREVLDRFQAAIGLGVVRGPHACRRGDMWTVRVHGVEAVQAVAAMLWSWLGAVKKAQIARVLADAAAHQSIQQRRQFTAFQVSDIKRRLAEGERQRSIAMDLGCDRQSINRIARGRAYRSPEEIRRVAD